MSIYQDADPADIARGIERAPTVLRADVVSRWSAHGNRDERTEIEIVTRPMGVPVEVANTLYGAGWPIVTAQAGQGKKTTRIRAARREEVAGL